MGEREKDAGGPGAGLESSTPDDDLIGRIAVEWGLISPERLRLALDERGTRTLGQVLVEREWIRVDQLIRVVAERENRAAAVPRIPRYEIRDKLGEGASAVVYRAWDRELRRPVALKVLRDVAGGQIVRDRFRREAQAAAALAHPNVVAVHDAGEADGRLYLVMELVDGRPLSEVIAGRLWGERELVAVVEKAARGLSTAHARGIVHRDLKPANIMISPAGEPKVGDFGLAHLLDSDAELTKTGTTLGTPLYMSPEQVRGEARAITPATDVYALGTILYEALVGRPPHLGESIQEIYDKIVREEPVAPRRVKPAMSDDLQRVLLKALDKHPGSRYPSAGALADDLRRWLDGEPVQARPLPGLVRAWRRALRHRVKALLVAGAVLGALSAGWALGRARGPEIDVLAPGRPELDDAYYRKHDLAVPLLSLVEPALDRVSGEWTKEAGRLSCGSLPFTKLQFAYSPPPEYDLLVEVSRAKGYGDVNLLLSREGTPFLWAMGASGNTVFGFASINGAWAASNPTTRLENPCLVNGRVYTVVVQVRRNGLWAYVDGKLKSSWKTDYRDLGGDDEWNLPDPARLGLGTYESPSEFRRVSLLEVSGKGRRLR